MSRQSKIFQVKVWFISCCFIGRLHILTDYILGVI